MSGNIRDNLMRESATPKIEIAVVCMSHDFSRWRRWIVLLYFLYVPLAGNRHILSLQMNRMSLIEKIINTFLYISKGFSFNTLWPNFECIYRCLIIERSVTMSTIVLDDLYK